MKILGVDPSTKTGMALVDFLPNAMGWSTVNAFESMAPAKHKDWARTDFLATRVVEWAHKADHVVLEGLSYSSKFVNQTQVEIAVVIRYALFKAGIPFINVPPTSLKKFVTGKGNCRKDMIMLHVFKRWNFEPKTDNIADAFGLAMFGGALYEVLKDMPQTSMAAVSSVRENI